MRVFLTKLSCGLICALATIALVPPLDVPTSPVRATLLELHDGDTAKVDIHLPFDVDLPKRSVRAFGYDAWEITKTRQTVQVTDAEIIKGKKARNELLTLIESGELYLEDSGKRDPYGRASAWLWVKRPAGWVNVAQWMTEKGHVRK